MIGNKFMIDKDKINNWLVSMLYEEDLRRAVVITSVPVQTDKFCCAFVSQSGEVVTPPQYNSLYCDNIIPLYVNAPSIGVDAETFYSAVHKFAEEWESERNLKLTSITDSSKWVYGDVYNLERLSRCNRIGELKLDSKEVNVVASGPSLDGSIDSINTSIPTISVNSSCAKLQSSGVSPDYVVSCDYRDSTYESMKDFVVGNSKLICPMHVNPSVLNMFSDENIYYWVSKSTVVKKITGMEPDDVSEVGTVSVSMLDLAARMGAKKVYIYGQDCCYSDEGEYYNASANGGDRAIDGDNCPLVLCNDGKSRKTNYILLSYKGAVEQIISKYPDVEFVNMSKTGAKLEGSKVYA